jgi:hypothetical protein
MGRNIRARLVASKIETRHVELISHIGIVTWGFIGRLKLYLVRRFCADFFSGMARVFVETRELFQRSKSKKSVQSAKEEI